MQPRPIAETERELPSVRFSVSFSVSFINDGDPDSAALRRSPTRRLPPGKVYGRDCNPAAGGLPALRVSRDVLLSVLPGTWEPPAARAANGVPGGIGGAPAAPPPPGQTPYIRLKTPPAGTPPRPPARTPPP